MSIRPVIISTWPFGLAANEAAAAALASGGNCLDAVEKGINVAEDDPEVTSVGFGGLPNAQGIVEVDAAVMYGPTHGAGSVAGVRGLKNPISLARKVMQHSRHVMLVGEGAREFALRHGFPFTEMLTEPARAKWIQWLLKTYPLPPGKTHDTIGMVALDASGDLAVGCSTSGYAWKEPGRVGDSPLIGSGLYVDNEVGGAAATGLGESILKYCLSFLVVEGMRQGLSPQTACEAALRRMKSREAEYPDAWAGLVALNKAGEYGAACCGHSDFPYALHRGGKNEVLTYSPRPE
ncbi:MAG: N(4)-(beta-N-acetylglucosaminyl)-L-asparaginase [Armatimonadetes bacterium]|nr:N(4)-(beta-N-acetylglucosaminyl)-L-asparaginase [Armatimonadota bacterium]